MFGLRLSYLPNRQLRKEEQIAELKQKGYLPNRQLRNDENSAG